MVNCYERAKTSILITSEAKSKNLAIVSLEFTAEEISEEGGDHGKSSWPLRIGLHMCYNGNFNEEREIFE